MSILEFFLRILDNVVWIGGTEEPAEIFVAITNILQLFMDNFSRLFVV